jgi:hypothetical protein
LNHLSGFPNIAGQRLLTSNADQLPFAGVKRITDGLHILKTLVVWTTEPYTIDLWSGNHFFDRIEWLRIADAQIACECRRCCCMLRIWTIDTKHVGVAHATPRLEMKLCDKTTTDKSNT